MNNGHTPGPWICQSGSVYRAQPMADGWATVRLATMDRDEPATAPWERDANARLMAAAPDLLAALADLVDQLEGIGVPDWRGAEGLTLALARATIAAAREGHRKP